MTQGDLFTLELREKILEITTLQLQKTRAALAEAIEMLEFDGFSGERVDQLRAVLADGETK